MSAIRPFVVERCFADAVSTPAVELSEELQRLQRELADAEERARIEAHSTALAEFRADRDTALLAACDALQASVEMLLERWEDTERQLIVDAAELALAAGDAIAGASLEERPLAAIASAIDRALKELRRGTPLEVRVHPDLCARMEELIAEKQAGDRRRLHITVIANADLPLSDARLRWGQGEALVSREARRAALMRELEELLSS